MKPDRRHDILSGRLRLHVAEWGPPDAPVLLLQHGGRDHARSWDAVAGAFAGRYRVVAPDLRGHGDSDWAQDGSYALADFVFDMTSVFDALALPPCAVIGHSLGGNIVTRFAGLFPDRVRKLVNIEGLGFPAEAGLDQTPAAQLAQLRDWMGRQAVASARRPARYPDLATAVARLRQTNARLSEALASHLVREGVRLNADGTLSFKHDPGILAFSPLDLPLDARHALWGQVACPMLAVYGAESWAKNPEEDGRLAFFRDARLITFERAGHWAHHDRFDDFVDAADAFLRE